MTYVIIVSEPWDYHSPEGDNLIKGNVLKRFNRSTLLFEAEGRFTHKETAGTHFLISTRFNEDEFGKEPFDAVVNVELLQHAPSGKERLEELRKISEFVIIGRLKPSL